MAAVVDPSSVTPEVDPNAQSVGEPADRSIAGPIVAGDLVRGICPYLGTGDGWRLAVPDRVHRCLAVAPPVPLALDKQRRLCLVAEHRGCATFVAAASATGAAADDDSVTPAAVGSIGSTGIRLPARTATSRRRWPVPRTQPTVLDPGRGSVDLAAVARQRTTTQVGLVLLALVAFGVLILARLGAGGAPAQPAGGVPAVTAASAAPSAAAPSPTIAPSPSAVAPSTSPLPSPSASATAATATPVPSARRYTVRAGDTLGEIASRFGTTVKALRTANGISDPTSLQIGQVLIIP